MKQFAITTTIAVATPDELPQPLRDLAERARLATFRSYAPYSHFSVGAAVLLSNGEIVEGSNQENVAYPSGLCAERTAAYYAHATHPTAHFEAIAIAARGTDGHFVASPISPCGACRQALLEYENLSGKPMKVLLVGANKVYMADSVSALMPLAFVDFE